MVTTGRTVLSSSVICPLPMRVPEAPPPRPVAVSRCAPLDDEAGIHSVTVSSVALLSAAANSAMSAPLADPPALPLTVTVLPVRSIPVGRGGAPPRPVPSSLSVKSVPRAPSENCSGIARLSPANNARRSPSWITAASLRLTPPSRALGHCTPISTSVASSSFTVTGAELCPPTL